jgi:DNA cross-link repair 1A protein
MFLFKVPARAGPTPLPAQTILHTGDLRWHPRMANHPALRGTRIDILFLDTTYCLPKFTFPTQVSP